jgi:hypothetical protein
MEPPQQTGPTASEDLDILNEALAADAGVLRVTF